MKFIRAPRKNGVAALLETLQNELATGHNVLWLVSGGSNVSIATEVLSSIPASQRLHLTVGLIDERYGAAGFADSNGQKLLEAGFDPSPGIFVPTLEPGFSLEATASNYADALQGLFATHRVVIGQLGIGADGHTAGILPDSPICTSTKLVDSYQGPDFERISLTFEGLKRLTKCFVFCYGPDKSAMLRTLSEQNLALAEQPSQILKQLTDVTIYNEAVEGEVE